MSSFKPFIIVGCLSVLVLAPQKFAAQAWNQKGADIDGAIENGRSGWSVSMPDANTVAIGGPYNDSTDSGAGHVRVFTWDSIVWVQKGQEIIGEVSGDYFGNSVSMPDPNTLAIGSPYEIFSEAGNARIYSWNSGSWVQKGQNLAGSWYDEHTGFSVSMPDSNTVAIGVPGSTVGIYTNVGSVRIYSWDDSIWVHKGFELEGSDPDYGFGSSVSMPDSNTIAIGSPDWDGFGGQRGHVCIYKWNGWQWLQRGLNIYGEDVDDRSGYSVSMPDSNTVAIGAPFNAGTGVDAGHVRVYAWDAIDSTWVQKGVDIEGGSMDARFGWSVSMPDANTLATGAPTFEIVRIHTWDGSAWTQQGPDIIGEDDTNAGTSVCMPDPNTVAFGAPYDDGGATSAGHVRVYTLSAMTVAENGSNSKLVVCPNPTDGPIAIDLGSVHSSSEVIVRSLLGQEVRRKTYGSTDRLEIDITGDAGYYSLELRTGDGWPTVLSVIKE